MQLAVPLQQLDGKLAQSAGFCSKKAGKSSLSASVNTLDDPESLRILGTRPARPSAR